jgi:hypothetical protein
VAGVKKESPQIYRAASVPLRKVRYRDPEQQERHLVQTARGCPTLRFDVDFDGFNHFLVSLLCLGRHVVSWVNRQSDHSGSEMTNGDGVIAVI